MIGTILLLSTGRKLYPEIISVCIIQYLPHYVQGKFKTIYSDQMLFQRSVFCSGTGRHPPCCLSFEEIRGIQKDWILVRVIMTLTYEDKMSQLWQRP